MIKQVSPFFYIGVWWRINCPQCPAQSVTVDACCLCVGAPRLSRISHIHILEIIVHGEPVHDQTGIGLLFYWCMVAKQLPAVSSPVCDGGCLIALCCDRRAPTGSPVQTFDHAVHCRLAFVCFEKGKCRRIRQTAWC